MSREIEPVDEQPGKPVTELVIVSDGALHNIHCLNGNRIPAASFRKYYLWWICAVRPMFLTSQLQRTVY